MLVSLRPRLRSKNNRWSAGFLPNANKGRPSIVAALVFPNAVPRHLESLTLKLYRCPGVVNVKDLCRAAPSRRAFTIRSFQAGRGISDMRIRAIK